MRSFTLFTHSAICFKCLLCNYIGLASWVYHLCLYIQSCVQKGPTLGLMLYYHYLENLKYFFNKEPYVFICNYIVGSAPVYTLLRAGIQQCTSRQNPCSHGAYIFYLLIHLRIRNNISIEENYISKQLRWEDVCMLKKGQERQ